MAKASAVAGPSSSSADGDGILVLENPPPIPEGQKRRRKNLPKEGYSILQDYFFNVSRYPKKHERIELAARVNSLPGGSEPDAYTPLNVEFYFTNMRRRHPQASTVVVKRELVEEPLSFGAGATNGTTVEDNASSISKAPRKKRKLKATTVAESQTTPSAHSGELTMNGATIPDSTSSISAAPRKKRKSKATTLAESQSMASASSAQHLLSTASTEASVSGLSALPFASSAASASPAQKKRTRLKAEGYKILTDFFKNVSRYPTAAQKAELLATVTAIKGCEGYNIKKMTAYFSRMRIERREPVAFVKAESPDSQLNAASSFLLESPSGSSLVHPPFPEPEPEPAPARPPSPVTDSSPIPQLAPSVVHPLPILQLAPSGFQPQPQPHPQQQLHVQPPAPTPPVAQPRPFSASSMFDPIMYTPKGLPQPQDDLQTTSSDPPTTTGDVGAVEPDPPRNPRDPPGVQPSFSVRFNVFQPSPSSPQLNSDSMQTDAPATPDLVQPTEASDVVEDSSDPIPTPNPSPKSKTTTKSESPKSPGKRGLTAAALKLLDDYYATVSSSPSTVQSAALAAQVNGISEGARCTAKQVRKYFKRRRVEDKCEALKAERMGVGVDESALVLVAVVEPQSEEAVQETSGVDAAADDLAGALPSEIAEEEGGDEAVGSRVDEPTSVHADLSLHGMSNADAPVANDLAEAALSGLVVPCGGDEVGSTGEVFDPASGESLPETSNVDAGTRDLEEPATSSPPSAQDGGDKHDSDRMVPDIAMDDVSERQDELGDVVLGSPEPDQDGERSDVHAEILAEEERTDPGIEADVKDTELDSGLGAEVEPVLNSKLHKSLCDRDLDEGSATSSLSASGGNGLDGGDEVFADVAMDDVPESHEPEGIVLTTAEPEHDDECSDVHLQIPAEEEQKETGLETNEERAERDSEVVPEFQPEPNSKPDDSETMYEVLSDAPADTAEESVLLLLALDGEDERSSDQAFPEISMNDVRESPESDDAAGLESSDGNRPENDALMDVDPEPASSAVMKVDVLGLAAQLQRVFSRSPTLNEDHPTTFADFATWLEARNVNLVCASS